MAQPVPAAGPSRGARLVRHPVVGVVIITAASQLTSALGLFAMPLLGLATADAYSAGQQLGYAGFNGIVVGVVFEYAIGRPASTHWRRGKISAVAASLAIAAAVLIWQSVQHAPDRPADESEVLLLFGIGGAVLGLAGVDAVELACRGRPLAFAGLSLGPNIGLLVAVAVLAASGRRGPTAVPALAWLAGSVAIAVLAARARRRARQVAVPFAEPATTSRSTDRQHLAALMISIVASAVIPTVLIIPLGRLGTGVTTLLFIVSRIGTSLIGLGVNSLLLTRYNWTTRARSLSSRCWPLVAGSAALLGGADLVAHLSSAGRRPAYLAVALAWVTMLAVAAVVLREANVDRRGPVLLRKSIGDLVLSVGATAVYLDRPSVTGFLGVYTLSQATTVVACARDRRLAVAAVAVGVAAVLSVALGW